MVLFEGVRDEILAGETGGFNRAASAWSTASDIFFSVNTLSFWWHFLC
jgi:hypothetical protein